MIQCVFIIDVSYKQYSTKPNERKAKEARADRLRRARNEPKVFVHGWRSLGHCNCKPQKFNSQSAERKAFMAVRMGISYEDSNPHSDSNFHFLCDLCASSLCLQQFSHTCLSDLLALFGPINVEMSRITDSDNQSHSTSDTPNLAHLTRLFCTSNVKKRTS